MHEGFALKRASWNLIAMAVVSTVVCVTAACLFAGVRASAGGTATPAPHFVGSETCAQCHRPEAELWRTSQHSHAMAHATDKTVLGDFSGATFDHFGVRSRFFRENGKFLVETDGPDGKLAVFEIKYTFGLDPLQQYLIAFPDGRLQALSIAWDARASDKGGQRWFHLYPDEKIGHDDVLHWTKLNQNWNFMCAECHSTGVRKNYDATADRYATTWAEISVGCETCHGRGSRHLAWARERASGGPVDADKGLQARFDERKAGDWTIDPKKGDAVRAIPPATLRKEVETCGLCHARRGQSSENWTPGQWLSDTHVVAPLSRGLYRADGQMEDEVYNYGSFKQSRMFAAGVTCSDCHDPHSGKLRAGGDTVCLQCHAGDKYAAVTHHRHENASPSPTCASCHMPARAYMVIDTRRDHSFRVPRPDLSAALGAPNACNDCHTDRTAQWAAAAIEHWFGPTRKGLQTYGAAFHAAWAGRPDAAAALEAVAVDAGLPAFARAGALSALRPYAANSDLLTASLADPDPMVRIGALDLIDGLPPGRRWALAAPLLGDSVGGVRMRAVAALAETPPAQIPPGDRDGFERAAAEFVAAQRLNADRPEARSALARFQAQRGQNADAETEYKAALRLDPQYAPAAINLADLYRRLGRESEGEEILRTALAASPRDGALHHARGLALVRLKRRDEALAELRDAARIEPGRARYAYVYAIALRSAGRAAEAVEILKDSVARHPADRDTLLALLNWSRDAGDVRSALNYARQLASLAPGDRLLSGLVRELERQAEGGGK